LQIGTVLNNRELALRGYRGDEAALLGRSARVVSAEWRTPLADIDRHTMVPPVGINRLSAAVFVDAGGTWDEGAGPTAWRRGVGVELLAEVKLLYALGLQLRGGLARGLDEPRSTRGYATLGRAF
jgi:outer membrane protein assembly factor BamA